MLLISLISLGVWLGLILFWGQFWRSNQILTPQEAKLAFYPQVCAIIPARDEADVLPVSLRSLLNQDYGGNFQVILVDDRSSDGTADIAQETAQKIQKKDQLTVITADPLPRGWTGKLWAMAQGVKQAQSLKPDYILFTDADIEHNSQNISQLVAKAELENLELVSLMVKLRCQSFWEKMLIPAFIFFFQKLYPFPWVNNPQKKMAAAAGGCILVKYEALERIGGLEAVSQALIDDCALAKAVKSSRIDAKKGIWLGLTDSTYSLRPYNDLKSIWLMISRTAYTQLNYNPGLLLGTMVGMTLVYLIAPIAVIYGVINGDYLSIISGVVTWLLMAVAYLPTLLFYQISPIFSLVLPAIAFLYTLMTLDSARKHWQGQGGAWKGRVYQN